MSGEIFIETKDVNALGLTIGQHLYLVFRDSNGDEHALRSGAESRLLPFGEMRVEVNVAIEASTDDRGDETPEDRISTSLDFPGISDDDAWAIMVKYARQIGEAGIEYDLFEENSNAFVGALLRAAGGAPSDMVPSGTEPDEFVGLEFWGNIFADVSPPENGTFYGTMGNDRLSGLQIDETIVALAGDDVVNAGRGHDMVRAGRGRDWVNGESGHDHLIGGAGADALFGRQGGDMLEGRSGDDRLSGGKGADTLAGGRGDDVMVGGAGSDVFVFRNGVAGETDTIKDFHVSRDTLRFIGPTGRDALAMTERSVDGRTHTEVTWLGAEVRLEGVMMAELADHAFEFV